jgi:release factor glutamine methyltransferase
MTIQEAARYTTEKLRSIYEEGETEAMVDRIIQYLSKEKRTSRTINPKKELLSGQVSQLETIISRLLTHEPLQYVLHEAWFCGLKFYVDKNVLIPRPETEELVEWIISDCKFPIDTLDVLDIGTGSGCIAVALKRRLGRAEVWSCDKSEAALRIAIQNAATMNVDIRLLQIDFLSVQERNKLPSFDIIVSNPPYIPEKDRSTLSPNVLQYEPAAALFVPDNDPLVFYKAIADFGKEHLQKNGNIYMEIHKDRGTAITELFQSKGYNTELKKDMQGHDRMVKAVLT